ncbi:MAG: 4-hydroxybenzoate octaprenyltransferase [Holosporales bacterium]
MRKTNLNLEEVNAYIELSRIKKPTGFLLLWIPCLFGLSLSSITWREFIFKSLLFLIGAIFLRTVGCIVNDICDRNFDRFVERTKNRPLACGALTVKQALIFLFICLVPSFFIFLTLPKDNQYIALISLVIAFIYPLFKRFTHFPQFVLGIAFNSGIFIVGYGAASLEQLILIYIGSIFWTLAYDTIYAFQDEKDDAIIGVKSTAVYFKNHPKKIIVLFYTLCLLFFINAMRFSIYFDYSLTAYLTVFIFILQQINRWNPKDPKSCLNFFKMNVLIGFILAMIFCLK